jgi:hypothetical protein
MLDHILGHPLAPLEVPEPATPSRGEAEKYSLAPVVGRNVAVPFIFAEPL